MNLDHKRIALEIALSIASADDKKYFYLMREKYAAAIDNFSIAELKRLHGDVKKFVDIFEKLGALGVASVSLTFEIKGE